MRRVAVFVALMLGMLTGSCGSGNADSEDPVGGADGGAPFGLAAVALPATQAEVAAVFEAMPDELEGQPRVGEEDVVARYGGELIVLSAGLASDFDADTVVEDLSRFEDEPGAEIEDSELDTDVDLVFMVGSFQDEGEAGRVHVATWGAPDGEWLFSAGAPTPELRAALVEAFVEAAR